MPLIRPIKAIGYHQTLDRPITDKKPVDISDLIAPPYDVLDEAKKSALLDANTNNIVAVDLPHLPAKTVGPDETYIQAGQLFQQWLDQGVLKRSTKPALYVYQQTYEATQSGRTRTFNRRGLMCNVRLQAFGPPPADSAARGGVYPHEQTFASAKEDRLKLMRATRAQLSPIFGMYSDPQSIMTAKLETITKSRPADFAGHTRGDGVLHEVWTVDKLDLIEELASMIADSDVFIADGHHRYNTALMYREELESQQGVLPPDHLANNCLFVLVAIQDPGMIVLPTHRVLGGMDQFSISRFIEIAGGKLQITEFPSADGIDAGLTKLEAALPEAGHHAIGLYGGGNKLWLAITTDADPLANSFADHSKAWRQLDVAIAQHLIWEAICQPAFCAADQTISWKFPHTLEELRQQIDSSDYQLGLVMQPTPLHAVRQISEASELMPQKSTFFYPKLATGLVINPLE